MIAPTAFTSLRDVAGSIGADAARTALSWAEVSPADALSLATDVDAAVEDRYAAPDCDVWSLLADAPELAPLEYGCSALVDALAWAALDTYREHYRAGIDILAAATLSDPTTTED